MPRGCSGKVLIVVEEDEEEQDGGTRQCWMQQVSGVQNGHLDLKKVHLKTLDVHFARTLKAGIRL